ncbi:DUF3806 domain-containing protein [Jannaschia sp. W003]|uniref:DUF3806 domain-containing protein n=1 Tax=Jannaschia sp. W003 TaxID=2867012 RepID=UPI0021A6DAC6|nr:DUF3806 domain-containing protein [Jannaschia sp. W003]UWQ20944.1 DUF3806 domain-containing protein [Jannaschia sp. W003]
MSDARTPFTAQDRRLVRGWIDWVAGHAEPPAPMDSHAAIMDHLDGLLAQDFVREYGSEELFAIGIAWGDALRMRHAGWEWVSMASKGGSTVALDLRGAKGVADPDALVTPGHIFARRAGTAERLDPRAMEARLLEEIGSVAGGAAE